MAALEDLQKSIELNDNRAVYRSRLLLDEGPAARSVGLGSIYEDLGFQQLALVEGWKSLSVDPGNYSAHRFLADSYSALPRHEIARVSELLQPQLLQPINISPLKPHLLESQLLIRAGAGPADPSFNEYDVLFNRNRLSLLASGVAGENGTLGEEVTQSGIYGRMSYSVGQYRYETDGFRQNNDLRHDIYNVFTQVSVTPRTSIQAELRHKESEYGDLPVRFFQDQFYPTQRVKDEADSLRFGFHHSFAPGSDLITSLIFGKRDFKVGFTGRDFGWEEVRRYEIRQDLNDFLGEVQHIFRTERFSLITGAGTFHGDDTDKETLDLFSEIQRDVHCIDASHQNLYVYSTIRFPESVTWTAGMSADFFTGGLFDLKTEQVNPKFGLMWNPLSNTTLRAAAFRVLTRTLVTDQTIESTQVAGFNQFYDDAAAGTESWRYGVGIDQKFSASLFGGVEFSQRNLDVPYEADEEPGSSIERADRQERLFRAYLNWAFHPWLMAGIEYDYERLKRDRDFVGPELFKVIEIHRLPLSVNFFHPCGVIARLRGTYIIQEGDL